MCAVLQTDVSSHATLLGSEVDSGLSARCAEALFEAAAADPSLTSARLHVSFVEVTESAVYDIMASNPQQRGGKQDQREPWIEIDPASDSIGAGPYIRTPRLTHEYSGLQRMHVSAPPSQHRTVK